MKVSSCPDGSSVEGIGNRAIISASESAGVSIAGYDNNLVRSR